MEAAGIQGNRRWHLNGRKARMRVGSELTSMKDQGSYQSAEMLMQAADGGKRSATVLMQEAVLR